MTEEPQQPEGEAPEDETTGAPGEPGEGTPSDAAPEPEETGGDADETPVDPEAPGPEIEGLEELDQAAGQVEAAEGPEGAEAPEAAEKPEAAEAPEAAEEAPAAERPQRGRRGREGGDQEEVIPGAHLEPDLVLEEQRPEGEYGEYDEYADADGAPTEDAEAGDEAVEAAGYQTRMDVVARIHGGGVSAQATALRHGIARALVEADPALRAEMKRRGYLTRDPRQKERKKAGLKKARKRPQFSKR